MCASKSIIGSSLLLCVVLSWGCAGPGRKAVPQEFINDAQPIGHTNIRDWGDEYSDVLQESLIESIRQARAINPRGVIDDEGVVNILALSGGGSHGAYGAGLLSGWTASGTRPTFKLVTGISTGSLIAPFAFLGPDYDDVLRASYTEVTTKDIYVQRSMLSIMFDSSSLVDTTPLANMIERQITQEVLAEIAAEHRKGRRLFVGTTNIDAGRLVIWDMGAIADSGKPNALALFRKILRASAAIPVAFPPVIFDVTADGQQYDEMHVDGGTAVQIFFYGLTLDLEMAARTAGINSKVPARLYLLRNGTNKAPWQLVMPQLLPLANRAIGGILSAQGTGDLYRIYTIAQRDHIEFNLATIPGDFEFEADESFDKDDMNRLFDLAYQRAVAGYPWQKTPPGLVQPGHESTQSPNRARAISQ